MKIVAILVILCHSAHRNNSNYVPLLIGLYLYSAGARVDAITLLNHFGLSVSYEVLQKKLNDITTSSISWIKAQGSNCNLVRTWDNFEFRKNVHGERVGDMVKFRSVKMALWIQRGWRIPDSALKQWMWEQKREFLQPSLVDISVFGRLHPLSEKKLNDSIDLVHFELLFQINSLATILQCQLSIELIARKKVARKHIRLHPQCLAKALLPGNLSVFEDLNIVQMGLDKSDARWDDWLTLWWGDLKTEVQMLSMQAHGVRSNRAYDRYQHLFPGLALWHLRFNYLKMIWGFFYPGGSFTERSTLQWADHWHQEQNHETHGFSFIRRPHTS